MIVPKRKAIKLLKIVLIITAIAIVVLLVSVAMLGRRVTKVVAFISEKFLYSVEIYDDERMLTFVDPSTGKDYLDIYFPHKVIKSNFVKGASCREMLSSLPGERSPSGCLWRLNIEAENRIKAIVYESNIDILKCHSVAWFSNDTTQEITNCLNLEDKWYGGGGLSVHRWPLNRVNVPLQAHVTQKLAADAPGDTGQANFDGFIEPYFISAGGVSIRLEPYLPLFISINHNNDNKMCFTSTFQKPYSTSSMDSQKKLTLKYTVCKSRIAQNIHSQLLKMNQIPFFNGTPEVEVIRKPVWSTRGLDINQINEAKLVDLVKGIKSNDFPFGQMHIDGNYSQGTGSFYFNEKTFPHSHQLIMELNSPGEAKMPIGVEVYPHIQSVAHAVQYINTTTFQTNHYFLDVTNSDAVKLYSSHLTDLIEKLGIKCFRFSGGFAMDIIAGLDESFLVTKGKLENPNSYTNMYAQIASEFKGSVLMGSGYRSQSQTFIADAGPFLSSWEHGKGLKSVIPTVLTYGIIGYPFGLMGPVGGVNIHGGVQVLPEKELYIRWLQLMTYLPVMELSVGPWMYDKEVVSHASQLFSFRFSELWPNVLSSLVQEAVRHGTPIARPLWWVAAEDEVAQYIDCEFFLGNSLLVAPVLYSGARSRDVYLPKGGWYKDQLRGQMYEGGQWLHSFEVGLYEIATFKHSYSKEE